MSVNVDCRQPHKLCVVWMRHGRRLCSEVHCWESTVDDLYRGVVSWSVPENITATVTLFHGGKLAKCEDKSWMFIVENVSMSIDNLQFCNETYVPVIIAVEISLCTGGKMGHLAYGNIWRGKGQYFLDE